MCINSQLQIKCQLIKSYHDSTDVAQVIYLLAFFPPK